MKLIIEITCPGATQEQLTKIAGDVAGLDMGYKQLSTMSTIKGWAWYKDAKIEFTLKEKL